MSKTFALFKRMSPYLAEKARNLIDAMLLSTEEIGWDSQQQLIVNGRVYHDTDIVRLIAYIMSPANSISVKPIGLQVFISALRKIGLESDYVINQNVKRFLRKNNQSNNDDTETTDHDSEDEKEYETSDYNDSNLDEEEDGEAMDDLDYTNDDDDSCYEDDDCNSHVEDDDDDGDFDGKVNTDSEKEDESYDSGLDMKPASNGMMREYDWKSISDSDNESVASSPYH